MSYFAVLDIQVRQRLWHAARSRDLHDALKLKWRENDIVVTGPASAASLGNVGHGYGRSAVNGNLFQFAACEKTDPLAVGGEERTVGAFSARKRGGTRPAA